MPTTTQTTNSLSSSLSHSSKKKTFWKVQITQNHPLHLGNDQVEVNLPRPCNHIKEVWKLSLSTVKGNQEESWNRIAIIQDTHNGRRTVSENFEKLLFPCILSCVCVCVYVCACYLWSLFYPTYLSGGINETICQTLEKAKTKDIVILT